MRQVLKWMGIIFGGLLLLVIIAAPLVLGFFMRRGMPMMGGFDGMRGGHGFGMLWFLGGWMMLFGRVLFPLLIVGLLVWLAYSAGRNNARRLVTQRTAPAAVAATPAVAVYPAEPAAAPVAAVEAVAPVEAVEPAVEPACPNCGKTVLAGWVACPYCGEKL